MSCQFSRGVLIMLTTTALTGCVIKPVPIKTEAHVDRARADVHSLFENVEPMEKPLSLSEAVARGLLYNFDYKMGLMEEVLQEKQLSLANFNLLPRVAANAGYGWRSTDRATRSINFETLSQSLPHSFSEERHSQTADIGFSWNVLDFGLGYYQAKQQSDRVLAAVEKRRRVMNNMVKEIQVSYWSALTAQRLLPEVNSLLVDVQGALSKSKEIEEQKLESPELTLEYRRDLLQMLTQLKQLQSDLSIAKAQLSSLINIKPGVKFVLSEPDRNMYKLPRISKNIQDLQEYSLVFRPELREEAYHERINRQNIKKEIIRMFPGVSVLGSKNADANKYLKFQNWTELGVRATWNLMNVIQAPTAIKNARTQVEIDQMRRLSLTAAVLAQVTISHGEYKQAVAAYATASELSAIEKKMLKIAADRTTSKSGNTLELIRSRAQAVSADLARDSALANAKASLANLVTSVGLDIIPSDVDEEKLSDMALLIDQAIRQIESGDLDQLLTTPTISNVVKPTRKPQTTSIEETEMTPSDVIALDKGIKEKGVQKLKSFYELLRTNTTPAKYPK